MRVSAKLRKRICFTIQPDLDLELRLELLKKQKQFPPETQAEMFRRIIILGLNAVLEKTKTIKRSVN